MSMGAFTVSVMALGFTFTVISFAAGITGPVVPVVDFRITFAVLVTTTGHDDAPAKTHRTAHVALHHHAPEQHRRDNPVGPARAIAASFESNAARDGYPNHGYGKDSAQPLVNANECGTRSRL